MVCGQSATNYLSACYATAPTVWTYIYFFFPLLGEIPTAEASRQMKHETTRTHGPATVYTNIDRANCSSQAFYTFNCYSNTVYLLIAMQMFIYFSDTCPHEVTWLTFYIIEVQTYWELEPIHYYVPNTQLLAIYLVWGNIGLGGKCCLAVGGLPVRSRPGCVKVSLNNTPKPQLLLTSGLVPCMAADHLLKTICTKNVHTVLVSFSIEIHSNAKMFLYRL